MKKKNIVLFTILILITFMSVVSAAERVSLGFLYGVSDQIELVDRTNGSINQVAPTCLDLTSKGKLKVTKELTHEFVQAMHERGIKVTPFLSNHWVRSKGRAAIKNAEKLTDDIIETILEYQLDGVNVDIENLTPDDRDGFSELVRILKEKMPEDKLLTVSVAANPDGKETGWQGSYDYEKLGKYSDYLFVMTYDEHSQGGECGPVGSLEFIEKSIQYALKFVSKDKIVMGIPFYGRYWKNGEDVGGEAVVIGAVPSLISKNRGIVKYDEKIGEAKVTFKINNPSIKSKINGIELENGTYTIWYPNSESIKAKLNIVNEYDLLGAGVWALGQEKVDVWSYYKNELNRIPYVSPEEEKIREAREQYEALIVDMSNLEDPEILSLKYQKQDVNKTEENPQNTEKNDILYIPFEELKIIQGIIDKSILKNNYENLLQKKNFNRRDNIIDFKAVHIYQFCRKDILK